MPPRRVLLILPLLLAAAPSPKDVPLDPARATAEGNLLWYDAHQLGVEGLGWQKLESPYDRLPASAGGTVVTVGSTDWSHGLRGKNRVVERITRNLRDRLGKQSANRLRLRRVRPGRR